MTNNIQDLLISKLKKDLNINQITLTPIDKGVMSKVFSVTAEDNEYILRYDTSEQSRYKLEAWAMNEVRKLDVPTPKAIVTGTQKMDENEVVNYMLQEKLSGKALSDSFPRDISSILEETGTKLGRIHSIKLERFGHLTPEKVGVVRSWPEFMFYHFKSSNSDYLEKVDFLSSKELDKATFLINERISSFNLKQGYMLHVDLSLDHIFHINGVLEGLIDFQNVGSGDPLYDIATFEFYNETKYPNKNYSAPLTKGYGLDTNDETKQALTFYKLCLGIWKITGRIKAKRDDSVPRVKDLVKQYIKELD